MSQAKPEDHYHHGDLPATLMELALESIAREGTEKLSLRALARTAGGICHRAVSALSH